MTIRGRPRKRFGQHFLVDGNAIARIVQSLAATPGDPVLEIGPGRGALTAALLDAGIDVGAVEIDRDLAAELSRRFSGISCYTTDVLELDLAKVRADLDPGQERPLLIAGNLPYNISKPIAMKLIADRAHVERAVLMFQKEVADRLVARSGSRDYGPLTVLAGLAYDIRKVFDLGPRAFRPRPAVDSTVTSWRTRISTPLTLDNEAGIRRCLRASFARRRQTLRNNLRAALRDSEIADRVIESAGLRGTVRAEAVAPDGFVALAAAWSELAPEL